MSLELSSTKKIVQKFGKSGADTGSASVQVALLTERLNQLNQHFDSNPKDHMSRRGLLKLVGQRRRLLNYLSKNQPESYRKLIADLGIRR